MLLEESGPTGPAPVTGVTEQAPGGVGLPGEEREVRGQSAQTEGRS